MSIFLKIIICFPIINNSFLNFFILYEKLSEHIVLRVPYPEKEFSLHHKLKFSNLYTYAT